RELRADPQYADVALTTRFQMLFAGNGPIEIEGRVYKDPKDRPNANVEGVSDGYFRTLGARLVEGRDFTPEDGDQKLAVAIVDAKFAEKYFGRDNPIGRRFRTASPSGEVFGPWRTIVGVVSQLRMTGPFPNQDVDDSGFYVPFTANPFGPAAPGPSPPQFATVVVRPAGQRAETLATPLRRDLAKIDPDLPLYFVATPAVNADSVLGQNRVVAIMFSLFGLVAVILSAVGLYGIMSFAVSRRTQEFGTRMALGADAGRILKMVLRQGLVQLALGLALGLALTLAIATAGGEGVRRALFQVDPRDPLVYLSVSLLISAVAFVATLVPARRATRVDPILALRAE
ncbi:MAG TPA: FtsX-like permease family protein, partial [Gaiellaceae bacterium]|nr:FtsX-like permease family protein [Gaiellaceae bacterium]